MNLCGERGYLTINNLDVTPNGKGHFSANGDLSMAGKWQIGVQIRTPDGLFRQFSAARLLV